MDKCPDCNEDMGEVTLAEALLATIVCPVCDSSFTMDDAAVIAVAEHFQSRLQRLEKICTFQ